MSRTARILSKLFFALFVIAVVAAAGFLIVLISSGIAGQAPFFEVCGTSVSFVLSAATGCVLLYVAVAVFRDVAESQSPFSIAQAKRLKVLAVLLLTYAVIEAVISVGPFHATVGIVDIDYITAPSLYLDIKLVIASIACFCLSYVFRYGALLQWLQDETL